MFEKTAINPELVESIEQVYVLRELVRQWYCDDRIQQLTVVTDVERSRSIVALIDVLFRSQRLHKVLVISRLSRVLQQIQRSFQLHTDLTLQYIDNDVVVVQQVNFVRYQQFLNLFGYDDLDNIFNQFDLIIVDDPDNQQHEIFMRKLVSDYNHWILKVYLPEASMMSIV